MVVKGRHQKDAFSLTEFFSRIFDACKKGAVLSTYCSKGYVRRILQSVGFSVERLPGPIGKRQILRAIK